MGTYIGTAADEIIEPGFISPTVTADPPGTMPSEGDDILSGGGGADVMTGGQGNDTYYIDDAGDVVTEDMSGSGGVDKVVARISYTLGAGVEHLTLTLTGPLDDDDADNDIDGTGNDLNNILRGNEGSNVLNGGAGADTMAGDQGDDTYYVDDAGDEITEFASHLIEDGLEPTYYYGGHDGVFSEVTFALGTAIEYLALTGSADINATGNSLNNTLTGNSAANVLNGGGGADTMRGGAGHDTYTVDNAGDVVMEDAASTGGVDRVLSSISYTLGAGVENLTLTGGASINGTGNSQNNSLTGRSGTNVLKGGAGKDALDGGKGQDKLIGGGGNDEFVFAKPGQSGDTITDFKNTSGNNDRFGIDASSFKGGLDVGKLSGDQFQVSNDHDAQDADVRFIFDTRDNTLWFDKNGDADGGLRLVADLQASADVEARDIFLI